MSEIRFGAYRVVETVGSGAISTIYKAVQEPLGRVVALKALKTPIAPTSSFAEQLDREAKILADLLHPNIVLLLDHAKSGAGRPFLVLEHVDGPSLDKLRAKKKRLAPEHVLAVAIGIASALEHAHDRGVVHRDVKPANVLVSKTGVVKLIDFGIAQRPRVASVPDAEGITPSGRMAAPAEGRDAFGTPAYMSPEQILGDFVDGRSDLFSLGAVLYELLSGEQPFAGQRIRRDDPAQLRDVPRPVERIVMRLLEKSPSERWPSAAAVRERLETALRAMTRDDPASVLRGLLVETGFASPATRRRDAEDEPVAPLAPWKVAASHLAILAAFAGAVIAIEGTSSAAGDTGRALELVPEKSGSLRVVVSPWAHVKIDGQPVDTTPFARAIPLTPGKHWVTLVHPAIAPVEREVNVNSGEISTLDVALSIEGDAGTAAPKESK